MCDSIFVFQSLFKTSSESLKWLIEVSQYLFTLYTFLLLDKMTKGPHIPPPIGANLSTGLILFLSHIPIKDIPNICTKFQNPMSGSSWEIYDTNTRTNIVTGKTKTVYLIHIKKIVILKVQSLITMKRVLSLTLNPSTCIQFFSANCSKAGFLLHFCVRLCLIANLLFLF